MGIAYSLYNTRVTVSSDTLEKIIDLLKIPTKADQDRIRRDGILIVKAPSAPGGGRPRAARARSRPATDGGVSSTRSRTSRRQT